MNKIKTLIATFNNWRLTHISDRTFIIMLSILSGLVSGIIAVFIKNLVFFIENIVKFQPTKSGLNFNYLLFPLLGIFFVILFKKLVIKKKLNYGIPGVLSAISKKKGYIPKENIYAPGILSSITLGFGGSVGMEGPSVNTGGAVGSVIGRYFGLSYQQIVLLIACGSAGAIASLFKAPITGVVLALEILMIDLSMSSIVPLLIASVTGTLTSYFFLGQNTIYNVASLGGFRINDVPYYALLGIVCGLVSVYFTRIIMIFNKYFDRYSNILAKMFIGSILLGVIVMLFPAIYGEGYHIINSCLKGNTDFIWDHSIFSNNHQTFYLGLLMLGLIILFKAIATSLTLSSGGVGGIFGPTLFLGATTGLLFSQTLEHFKLSSNHNANFALAGMTGLIAGVMHAPLTGIFLIIEISSSYEMVVPLILTAAISFITIRIFIPYSIDALKLAEKGELITHDKDKSVLSKMKIDELVETDFNTVSPHQSLGELIKIIAQSNRNIFPVTDPTGNLIGIINLNDIRQLIFDTEIYDTTHVKDLMTVPSQVVSPDESMEEIALKFENSASYNIPVVKDGKYIGFVSRAHLFSEYRQMIKDLSVQ